MELLQKEKWRRLLFAIIFLIGGLIRAIDVWRPIDGTIGSQWREPDVAGIARNFYREGMNIFYPRIDWRGDGPGFVESEFPLYPWAVACFYHLLGYHEEIARVLSYLMSLASFAVFFRMASFLLPYFGAIAALLIFAFNPLAFRLASAVQPEPLMFLAYLIAVYSFLKWCNQNSPFYYWCAFIATTIAILAKLPAIHIGFLLSAVSIDKFGWKAWRRKDLWFFAIGTLLISLLWYAHARGLWLKYGNSLGMSNEAYLRIGVSNFLRAAPAIIFGIVQIEIKNIWMPTGIVIGVLGLRSIVKERSYRFILYWLGALVIFYLVTGRTTGEGWADYYHIVSVPPAALLIGLGIANINQISVDCDAWKRDRILVIITGVFSLIVGFMLPSNTRLLSQATIFLSLALGLTGAIMFIPGLVRFHEKAFNNRNFSHHTFTRHACPVILVFCFSATLFFEVWFVRRHVHPRYMVSLYDCAKSFKEKISDGSLIVASGAPGADQYGLPSAYNAPFMLFWMDKKGFNICDKDQSIEQLEEFRKRGVHYFVALKYRVRVKDGFESRLFENYKLIQECDKAYLFDLSTNEKGTNAAKASENNLRVGEVSK